MKNLLMITPWLADFGHGIILTIIVSHFFNIEPQAINFIFGILFSIAPDLDGIKEFLKFKKVAASEENPRDHRDGLHFPLVWIFIGIIFICMNPYWGTLFLSSAMFHFLNDSWGTGWGVQWLWPFSKNSYKFFSRKDIDSYVGLDNFIINWNESEKTDCIKRLGNSNWLNEYFLGTKRPIIIIIEYGTFIVSIILLLIYLF